ncbi:acetylglutamate kinase [Candidatus Pelagibacter sp.]|nr:acetylglutamate kinase [Candidatus Pelagibacter sp.]MDC1246042.1 acetylglutamate kinase [Pelagibacteraceae bacterium]
MSSLKEENLINILPKDGPNVEETIKYLEKYTEDFIVIKMGGSVLSKKNLFNNLIQDIVILKKLGLSIFLIHGGGSKISKKLDSLNIKSNFINGLRVTDDKIIDIVEDVLVQFNKEIVDTLNNQSCDAKEITSKKNNIIIVEPENDTLGFVGKPIKININTLTEIIKANEVPVIASLGLDKNNQTFNINADSVAGAIAKELKARRLLILSDVEGVLDKNKKLIPEINSDQAKEMIVDGAISGGMIPKINNCLDVAKNGVKAVCIIDGRKNHSVLFELLSDKGSGTLIRE